MTNVRFIRTIGFAGRLYFSKNAHELSLFLRRVNQFVERFTDDLGFFPAIQSLRGGIPIENMSLPVIPLHGYIGCIVEIGKQLGFADAGGFFSMAALRNITEGADDLAHVALIIQLWFSVDPQPNAILSHWSINAHHNSAHGPL